MSLSIEGWVGAVAVGMVGWGLPILVRFHCSRLATDDVFAYLIREVVWGRDIEPTQVYVVQVTSVRLLHPIGAISNVIRKTSLTP